MRTAVFLALFALPAVACSSTDDARSSSSDVVINPSGPGADIMVQFAVPAGVWPAHYYYRDIEVLPNQATNLPAEPDADGSTPISVRVTARDGSVLQASWSYKLTTGANTIFFGALELEPYVAAADFVYAVDTNTSDETTDALAFADTATTSHFQWSLQGTTDLPSFNAFAGGPVLPMLPGDYSYAEKSGNTTATFTVLPVRTTAANLNEWGRVALITLKPDPTPPQFPADAEDFNVWCTQQTGLLRAGESVAVVTRSTSSCSWGIGPVNVLFTVAPADTYVAQLHHLDVDDVALTDGPGTVKGSFTVSTGGKVILGPLPTKSGVDVPPGTYTIATSYSDAASFTHTTTNTVTF